MQVKPTNEGTPAVTAMLKASARVRVSRVRVGRKLNMCMIFLILK